MELLRRDYSSVNLVRRRKAKYIEINRIILLSIREAETLVTEEHSLERIIANRSSRKDSFYPAILD